VLPKCVGNALGLLLGIAMLTAGPLSAQTGGQITGRVVNIETGQPLGSVQVFLEGTSRGSITRADGTFTISDVPPGTYTVATQSIGYQQQRQTGVQVTAGASTSVTLQLSPAVLALQGIVATGLIDPVEGVRSPITVSRVTREMMPVTAAGPAVQNLQGRVAGVSMSRPSGQPGTETTMMLRTPTSVTQAGNPLIVVDGVILGSEATANIESMDIESIEVIKGASAASLYGSRAAAGVISITTNRGRGLGVGQTQFTARNELGRSETVRMVGLPRHHHFLVDNPVNPTTYVDAQGRPVAREQRVTTPIAFMDTPYPGPLFDNLRNVFRPGNFDAQSFTISQNGEATNFAISMNRRADQGAMENNGGYRLNSFRVNLDHRFMGTMTLAVTGFHSRDWRDDIVTGGPQGDFFQVVMNAPPDVDLGARDPETGQFVPAVGAGSLLYENPLWRQATRDAIQERGRTLASADLRWAPRGWMTFQGNASYDRMDTDYTSHTPRGVRFTAVGADTDWGYLQYFNSLNDTWNASAQSSLRSDFGLLNARTTVRTLLEQQKFHSSTATGENFFIGGLMNLAAAQTRTSNSNEWEIQALGYLWDTAFDYDGKYILTGLVRRDGSSLFGPDNRWHNYYRLAGAWRVGEEPWFNLPNVDEFKLSYARGTAGGRPPFAAQYETWNITPTGPTKATLGNRFLRPEHTTEQEFSLDMILFNRVGIDLTYAWQRTTDQLVQAPLVSVAGFGSQWQNGGTVVGQTLEMAVEAQVLQTPTFRWMTNVVADRSRGRIEEWPYPCQNPIWRMFCEGVGIYEIWGGSMVRSQDELAAHHGGRVPATGRADEFQVNDDGFLVWVGAGNSYRDGIAKNLWGTTTSIDGRTYRWGMPFLQAQPDGSIWRQQIGDASHVNLGWVNNFAYRGFNFNAHMHAALGGDAINRSFQEMVMTHRHPAMDQAGKPDELKKPVAYYTAMEGGTGNDAFLESADYLKLRSLSVNYRLNRPQLARLGMGALGVEGLSLGLVGRELFTVTNYGGFDPEQALNFGNRLAQDRFSYPSTRNYTFEVQVTF
jgi:TonB-linked SusC/RagA family outer membrane protein